MSRRMGFDNFNGDNDPYYELGSKEMRIDYFKRNEQEMNTYLQRMKFKSGSWAILMLFVEYFESEGFDLTTQKVDEDMIDEMPIRTPPIKDK